jgi:hypothetical protein
MKPLDENIKQLLLNFELKHKDIEYKQPKTIIKLQKEQFIDEKQEDYKFEVDYKGHYIRASYYSNQEQYVAQIYKNKAHPTPVLVGDIVEGETGTTLQFGGSNIFEAIHKAIQHIDKPPRKLKIA